MSGSSLDGLDIALCRFRYNSRWTYEILETKNIKYTEEWILNLREAPTLSGESLMKLNINYGKFIGTEVKKFIRENNVTPELIASHGHTVFHNPDEGYTLQIGDGQSIATSTGIITIVDFRSKDIANGGQGAPLVPIGDKLLFGDFDYCVNLGGIANISFDHEGERIGFDISPANQILNYLSNQLGFEFDEGGRYAQLGKMNSHLFDHLNNHIYYSKPYPKSLSNSTVRDSFLKIIDSNSSAIEDKLYTTCKHIAYQINKHIKNSKSQVLLTGGGAHNTFLIEAIKQETGAEIIVPDENLIDYKEALIFAFMGLLRIENQTNCLSSVTGAQQDSSSGSIFFP